MATQAEEIVASGRVPAEWSDDVDAMIKNVTDSYAEVDRLGDTQIQAVRFARDDDGNGLLDDDGNQILVALMDENGRAVMEDHPLVHNAKTVGLLNYRYEQQDDGSVVALYVKGRNSTVKMKAFPNIEEASLWSPRDES